MTMTVNFERMQKKLSVTETGGDGFSRVLREIRQVTAQKLGMKTFE